MNKTEAANLKVGDLVVVDNRNQRCGGLVLEIESIDSNNVYDYRVTLKQPGFDGGFRLVNYDTRHLQRYEP